MRSYVTIVGLGLLATGCAGMMTSAMGGKEVPQVPATEAPAPKEAGSSWFCAPTTINGRKGSFCSRSIEACRKETEKLTAGTGGIEAGECRRQETASCKYLWVKGGKDGDHLCYMATPDCETDPTGKYGYEGDKTSACADYK